MIVSRDNVRIEMDGKKYMGYVEEHEIFYGCSGSNKYVFKAIIKNKFEKFHGFRIGKILGIETEFYCGDKQTIIEAREHSHPLLGK